MASVIAFQEPVLLDRNQNLAKTQYFANLQTSVKFEAAGTIIVIVFKLKSIMQKKCSGMK